MEDLACLEKPSSNTPTSSKPEVMEANMLGSFLDFIFTILDVLSEVEPNLPKIALLIEKMLPTKLPDC